MNTESLAVGPDVKGQLRHLLSRSCISIFVVVALVVLVSFLPHPRFKHQPNKESSCVAPARLKQTLVLHRHGERTPINWYGFEGDWPWELWSPGKLTVHGMEQGFALGQSLRTAYAPHMNLEQTEPVTMYSTDVDRTVDTATSLLLGLFSEEDTPTNVNEDCGCRKHGERSDAACIAKCLQLKPDVPSVPAVQVRGRPDPALYQAGECKGWIEWLDELESSSAWTSAPSKQFPEALKEVQQLVSGDTIEKLEWPSGDCDMRININSSEFTYLGLMESVWSNLKCYDSAGYTYSQTISNKDLLSQLDPVADYAWKEKYTPAKGPLTGGILLGEWIKTMTDAAQQAQACVKDRKAQTSCTGGGAPMTIYSAHDTTVFSLLAALEVAQDVHVPHFTSHVVMELWDHFDSCSNKHEFFIDISYDGKAVDSPVCRQGRCELEGFVSRSQKSVLQKSDCDPQDRPTEYFMSTGDSCGDTR